MKLAKLFKEYNSSKELERAIRKQLTEDNYMSDDDKCWTLTEIVKAQNVPAQFAMCALTGVDSKAKRLDEKPCDGMKYKLLVTTRQACYKDKSGRMINGYDILPADGTEIGEPALRPEWKERPQPGDVVRVKGNMLDENPDTGQEMSAIVKREMVSMGQDIHRYKSYTVDEDLCIKVSFEHASQLLMLHGHQLAVPKFKKLNKRTKDNDFEGQREIYNWHFKEVPPNYKTNKKDK